MTDFSGAALMVIDVQKAIDAPYHAADGPRNNLDAEQNIARLLRGVAIGQAADHPHTPRLHVCGLRLPARAAGQ